MHFKELDDLRKENNALRQEIARQSEPEKHKEIAETEIKLLHDAEDQINHDQQAAALKH